MIKLINPVVLAGTYQALKLHFTGSYDYFKYNRSWGREVPDNVYKFSSVLVKQYEITTKEEAETLISSVLVMKPTLFISDMIDNEYVTNRFAAATKVKRSIVHYTKEQFSRCYRKAMWEYPSTFTDFDLLKSVSNKETDAEVFVILNRIFSVSKRLEKVGCCDIIQRAELFRLNKYDKFISIPDVESYTKIREHCVSVIAEHKQTEVSI